MHLGRAVLVLAVIGGCRCGGSGGGATTGSGSGSAPPPPPRDAAVAPAETPLDRVQAKAVIGCLLDQARTPREVLKVVAEDAAPSVVQIAADVAVERARADGETPEANVLADLIEVATELDDPALMKTAFTRLDAMTAKLAFRHQGPQRARAGLTIPADEIAGDYLAITRERAIAGDVAGAAKFLEDHTKKVEWTREFDEQVGAFVAIGRLADARRVIAAVKAEDRLKVSGAWLDTALRMRAPLGEVLAAVEAEVKAVPEKGLMWFGARALFRRALQLGRGKELASLRQALLARYDSATDKKIIGGTDLRYDLAVTVGDQAAMEEAAKNPQLASRIAIHSGPLAAALTLASAQKYPLDDLVRVWARAVSAAPPGFGDTLVAATCKKPPVVPVTPTPPRAGMKLAVTEKARRKQQECALHDVIVRLTDGTELLEEETVEGECRGACTAAAKRAGEKSYQEILKQIESGEASESQTDYNFTDCMFVGPDPGRIDQIDGRDVAVIVEHSIGPHDVQKTSYFLALEVCGALHISAGFGGMYAGNWALDELKLRMTPDKRQLVVEVATDRWRGVMYRLTLPSCPGKPTEQVIETE